MHLINQKKYGNMEKIKIKIYMTLLSFCCISCSDSNIIKDIGTFQNEPLPGITIVVDPDFTIYEADGSSELTINLKATGPIDKEKRTVKISTDIGSFSLNGELKKSADVILNDVLESKITYVKPREGTKANIDISSFEGRVTNSKALTFKRAYPEKIVVEIPVVHTNDSTALAVKSTLLRRSGLVSTNLELKYQLMDSDNNELASAIFSGQTNSDSAGTSTANLRVYQIPNGTYTIKVSVYQEDGSILNNPVGTRNVIIKN